MRRSHRMQSAVDYEWRGIDEWHIEEINIALSVKDMPDGQQAKIVLFSVVRLPPIRCCHLYWLENRTLIILLLAIMNMAYSSPFRLWFSVQFSVKMVILSISELTKFKFECKAVEANSNGSTQRGEAADRKLTFSFFIFSGRVFEYKIKCREIQILPYPTEQCKKVRKITGRSFRARKRYIYLPRWELRKISLVVHLKLTPSKLLNSGG